MASDSESDNESILTASSLDSDDDDDGTETHYAITCDECGQEGLKGIRYKSTLIVDYDICQQCYEENHKDMTMANSFAQFKQFVFVDEEYHFDNIDELLVNDVHGFQFLGDALRGHPKVQKLDMYLDSRRECDITHEYCEEITNQIADCKSLKTVFVDFPIRQEIEWHQRAIDALLEGIAGSSSIFTVRLSLNLCSAPIMRSVAQMIRQNKNIRYLFLVDCPWQIQRDQPNTVPALSLFEALEETSLHSFVIVGPKRRRRRTGNNNNNNNNNDDDDEGTASGGFGRSCLDAAIRAMRSRPCLKRIKADFGDDIDDQELQELMQDKKQHWTRGWNDPLTTGADRLVILEEVFSCLRAHEQDQVAALYHFIRSNPGSLPHLV